MIFFKFPFNDKIFTVEETSSQKPISFVSFDQVETVDFNGEIKEIKKEDFLKLNASTDFINIKLIDFKEESQLDYEEKLENVIDFIQENQLSKLVISRRKLVDYQESKINFIQTFLNLSESYQNAFVYFFMKDEKCWMGAFSEVLGKFDSENSQFETMSLAGTLPINENWSHKEIEEQKPVTDFIDNIIEKYSPIITQSETYDHISGNIKHLRTDFKAEIKEDELENLIAELHPTPAVCGIPKEFCKNAIEKFENHPRKLYAGYIKVKTENQVQYFVNLRCAEFYKNAALIYVGGGITAESSPQKEWQETELKAEAILRNLVFS